MVPTKYEFALPGAIFRVKFSPSYFYKTYIVGESRKTKTGVLILAFQTVDPCWLLDDNTSKTGFYVIIFFKSYCGRGCFRQNIYQTTSLITSLCINMYQLFIFIHTFSRYQRHDIAVSIEVTTLRALQCTNSKMLIALMTLILTNELYPSRSIISLAIVIDVEVASNLKSVRNAVMSFQFNRSKSGSHLG